MWKILRDQNGPRFPSFSARTIEIGKNMNVLIRFNELAPFEPNNKKVCAKALSRVKLMTHYSTIVYLNELVLLSKHFTTQ